MNQTDLFKTNQRSVPKPKTPAPNICRDFLWYFKMKWEEKYKGREFSVTGKQWGQAKQLLKPVKGFPSITKEETFRRVERFLANPYFNGCSHAFNKLIEHWDMFTATIAAENKTVRSTADVEDIDLLYTCGSCGGILREKRSVWLRHRGKTIRCNCGTPFNVNDVLNKPLMINSFLPEKI